MVGYVLDTGLQWSRTLWWRVNVCTLDNISIYNIEPHEAVPEVSKGKVHITQNKHVPIEWFVTTASQSRIWLKLLSDDSNKVGICLLCRSTQLHATTSCRSQFATTCDSSYVLQSSTPYWKSTTLYYKVLIQYYSVLQSTTKYYSSTSLYYKVLLQYYSVVHSTTPVLLCTTQCYSSTTLYYKVLLQYHSVLQSTTQRHHFQTRMWTRNWRHSILHHLCKLPSMDPATMAKLRRSDARLDWKSTGMAPPRSKRRNSMKELQWDWSGVGVQEF